MNNANKILIFIIVIILAAGAILANRGRKSHETERIDITNASNINEDDSGLPRLVDLGAGSCVPCQMMVPELEKLEEISAGQFEVEYIDVHMNQDAANSYRIRVIPTQVYLDDSGIELSRHEGFISAEDMIAKWKELGYDFNCDKLQD